MRTVVGAKFGKLTSLGLVNDVRFVNCFWPYFATPTAIFAQGSSGLQIVGVPTPRNILFPADTIAPNYYPDALFPAEKAVKAAYPARKFMINLSDAEADVYFQMYLDIVATLPVTATKHKTQINLVS